MESTCEALLDEGMLRKVVRGIHFRFTICRGHTTCCELYVVQTFACLDISMQLFNSSNTFVFAVSFRVSGLERTLLAFVVGHVPWQRSRSRAVVVPRKRSAGILDSGTCLLLHDGRGVGPVRVPVSKADEGKVSSLACHRVDAHGDGNSDTRVRRGGDLGQRLSRHWAFSST